MLTNERSQTTGRSGRRCAGALFAALALAALCAAQSRADAIVMSTFDAGDEGWTAFTLSNTNVAGAPLPVAWEPTGGNPDGHISRADIAVGQTNYFNAPPAFLGNMLAAYNGSLTFDVRFTTAPNSLFNNADVRLVGGATPITLVFDIAAMPTSSWSSFSVPLVEGAWRVGSLTGALATQEQMLDVLASLSGLHIRGEFSNSFTETGFLDNVALNEPVPEPAALALMGTGLAGLALYARRRRASRHLARRYEGLAFAPPTAASSWNA